MPQVQRLITEHSFCGRIPAPPPPSATTKCHGECFPLSLVLFLAQHNFYLHNPILASPLQLAGPGIILPVLLTTSRSCVLSNIAHGSRTPLLLWAATCSRCIVLRYLRGLIVVSTTHEGFWGQREFKVSLLKRRNPSSSSCCFSWHLVSLCVSGGNLCRAADWKGCCICGIIFCPLNLLLQGKQEDSRRRVFARRALVTTGLDGRGTCAILI